MTFAAWHCAHGEATPATLQCADTVALAPDDDSVDTNTVTINGEGTINSFGPSSQIVLKRVKFEPSATIVLNNSATLNLLSGQQRSIKNPSYGMYHCDGNSAWSEVYFVQQGTALASELEDRIKALEEKLKDA